MRMFKSITLTFLISGLAFSPIYGKGAGTSAGLFLLQANGARPSAMGEAFSAAPDDISGFNYNPASLGTLKSPHATFQFQQGVADDAFSQVMFGSPVKKGSLGVSLGYYNGGTISLFDGNQRRSVTAKTDLVLNTGYAMNIGPTSIGASGKYISSELAETSKASALAIDLGVTHPLTPSFRIGAALQNFGTQLKFENEGSDLPRVLRLGAAYQLPVQRVPLNVMLDTPYFFNEEELSPSIGLEAQLSLLSVRMGYKSNSDLEGFSVGTGLMINRASLDYSFGLVDDLDSRHKISLSMRFGNFAGSNVPLVKKEDPKEKKVAKEKKEKKPAVAKKKETPKKAEPKTVKKEQKPKPTASKPKPKKQQAVKKMELPAKNKKRTVTEIKIEAKKMSVRQVQQEAKKLQSKGRPKFYVVKDGDTLEKIAMQFYGTKDSWTKIYDKNEDLINDPAIVDLVGQKLSLP